MALLKGDISHDYQGLFRQLLRERSTGMYFQVSIPMTVLRVKSSPAEKLLGLRFGLDRKYNAESL